MNIDYIEVPFSDLRQRELASFLSSDTRFDVIHVRTDWVAEFAEKGFLEPLGGYLESDTLDGFQKDSLENLSWKGELYGLPRYYWLWQCYYNTEILDQAGISDIPATWDELIAVNEKITATGNETLLTGVSKDILPSLVYILMKEEGGDILNADGSSAINSEAGVRAYATLKKLYDTGTLSPVSLELYGTGPATDLFVQGGYAFLLSTPHTYPMAQDPERSKVVGKVGVGLMPRGSVTSASWNETAGVAIPYNSKHKDLAFEFLKYVTSAEQQKFIAMSLGRIPTRPEVLEDPEVQNQFPHFSSIEKQVQYTNGMIKSPHAREIIDVVSDYTFLVLDDQISIDDALAAMETEINTIVKN